MEQGRQDLLPVKKIIRIPGSSAQADAVVADSQAAYAVLVTTQGSNLVSAQNIPDLQVKYDQPVVLYYN
ncbi:Ctr copper transporter [Aspergillus luchuensis]|uniref:Ctr copper transporter n=1 Tax=Aspergillus kawachii TaxID=1069201 RepID=A0A146F5F0_ASPKA|nr:Ctr copper transporter [Aspergillus luchuensis]